MHTNTHTYRHATHYYTHLKPLGDGNSQARHKCVPLFIMSLRDMVGRKKSYIFRSARNLFSQRRITKSSKIVESHSSLTRETQKSHFLRVSVIWLYKYQHSRTLSVDVYGEGGDSESILLAS